MVPPRIELEDTDSGLSLVKKAQKSPFLVGGMIAFSIIGGIGAYKWRTKTIPGALFLVQLRVAAQGTVIGFLMVGMMYHMYNDFINKKPKNDAGHHSS